MFASFHTFRGALLFSVNSMHLLNLVIIADKHLKKIKICWIAN